MKIGVLALQGAFIEHEKMLRRCGVDVVQVRLPQQLEGLAGLVIPGGESTTIGRLAATFNLMEPLKQFASQRPTWGTCAGMIFLAKDIGIDRQPILGLMDIRVNRNAFGRQIDSFEREIEIAGISGGPFHAVFIRAPVATHTGGGVEVLAALDAGRIVAVREGHLLGTAFHPELTDDIRVHQYFVDMCQP